MQAPPSSSPVLPFLDSLVFACGRQWEVSPSEPSGWRQNHVRLSANILLGSWRAGRWGSLGEVTMGNWTWLCRQ